MQDRLLAVLRFPIVAFAFLVDRLWRLPSARHVERRATFIAATFLLAAVAVLAFWMTQRSPQRVTIADLAGGSLAPMQSWIIVSGELTPAESTSGFRYTLTDPTVPNAKVIVVSDVELPVGPSTISGDLAGGGQETLGPGQPWVGFMRADPVLAVEPDPPWAIIVLVAMALFVVFAARTSYPVFFGQPARPVAPRDATLEAAVRPRGEMSRQPVAGALMIKRAAPVELRLPDAAPVRLRLHSARTNVEAGELRWLFRSQPALLIRPATGEITLSFTSGDDRDAAYTALIADAERSQMVAAPAMRREFL